MGTPVVEAAKSAEFCMRETRGWRWIAILLWIAPLPSSGVADSSSAPIPGVPLEVQHGPEQRITTFVHDWFAMLENPRSDTDRLDAFMAKPSFETSLIGSSTRDLKELGIWFSELRSSHSELRYRIESIDVEPAGENLHSVRFEIERRSVDASGLAHVARREHIWLVLDDPEQAPAILRIEERPLLAFEGTGPQITCY